MSISDPTLLIDELNEVRANAPKSAISYIDAAAERLESPESPGLAGPSDPPDLSSEAIAGLIDHTQLKPEAPPAAIQQVCDEAQTYGFASVCVHPSYVPLAVGALRTSSSAVCTVAGFPLGATQSSAKAHEARAAIQAGAEEIDMVLPIGRVKSTDLDYVVQDIEAVVEATAEAGHDAGADPLVKVIIETALLTDVEKALACTAAQEAGADFVKTSTGFSTGGARTEDVALMRQVVGDRLGVKASGGVGSAADVRDMVAHGATRIGASGSVGIMEGMDVETDY